MIPDLRSPVYDLFRPDVSVCLNSARDRPDFRLEVGAFAVRVPVGSGFSSFHVDSTDSSTHTASIQWIPLPDRDTEHSSPTDASGMRILFYLSIPTYACKK
jgi:hypothetical protein